MKTNENELGKLPKGFKKKWIKALRSKKFKQGKDALFNREEDSYCCLGVAAKICGVTGFRTVGYLDFASNTSFRGLSKVPSLLKGSGTIPIKLATMNDKGKSFEEIAEYIDINL